MKKAYILTILLIGLASYSSMAQGAKATMRVSVTVVSGTSVDVENPEVVSLTSNEKSHLGSINIKGVDEGKAFISNDSKIYLTDKNGKRIEMDIERYQREDRGTTSIDFKGKSGQQLMSSVYRGQLTTSIEYF